MYLASFAALLSLLNLHLSDIGKPILKLFNRPTQREKELREEKLLLKQEQNGISMTDEFAKYSKIQRKINAIVQELQDLQSNRKTNNFTTELALKYLLKLPFAIILIFMSVYYRYTPVIILDKQFDLFPFSHIISYPNIETNAISFHCWVVCCTTMFKLIKFN